MRKLSEIKEAMDDNDWPEHEFRSYCYELLGRLEIAIESLEHISYDAAATWIGDHARKTLKEIKEN